MLQWYYQPQEGLSKGETIMIYQRKTIVDNFYNYGNEIAEVVTRLPQENETIQIDVFNPQVEIKIVGVDKIECVCNKENSKDYDFYRVYYEKDNKQHACILAVAKAVENE